MLIDRTQEPLLQLLVDATRRADCHGPALAEAHRQVGRALAGSVADRLPLEDTAIDHVAGRSVGVAIRSGAEPIIIGMLRSGLFLAEGLWAWLPGSSLILHRTGDGQLDHIPATGRTVVVVDAVINTGKSIRPVLDQLQRAAPEAVVVAALVAHRAGIEALADAYPNTAFVVARVSDRTYVGRGGTDTGARLFGTTRWPSDQ